MKHLGGDMIAEGAFGSIYDDIKDIGDITKIVKHDGEPIEEVAIDKTVKRVFKLIEYPQERRKEIANVNILFELFKNNKKLGLTCLDLEISHIKNDNRDEFIVYRKFDTDLQRFLYKSEGGYEKTYTKNTENKALVVDPKSFIKQIMEQILSLCAALHEKGYIHKDIKLDNILITAKEKNNIEIVLGDYGLISLKVDEPSDYDVDNVFQGMPDYMPPFCHFEDNNHRASDNYLNRMDSMFVTKTKPIVTKSKHPRTSQNKDFFQNINKSYYPSSSNANNANNANKIDLHPIGIIMLQLLHYFDLADFNLIEFAKNLMESGGFSNAGDALTALKGGAKSHNVLLLGKLRKVVKEGRYSYVTVNGEKMTLAKAEKLAIQGKTRSNNGSNTIKPKPKKLIK